MNQIGTDSSVSLASVKGVEHHRLTMSRLLGHIDRYIGRRRELEASKECDGGGGSTGIIINYKGIVGAFETLRCQHYTKSQLNGFVKRIDILIKDSMLKICDTIKNTTDLPLS